MSEKSQSRAVRKQLSHTIHFHGRFGAMYFLTICCQTRRVNQLCLPEIAQELFGTARRYHEAQRWHLYLFLLMPDHLHAIIGISGDTQLSGIIRDFKRVTARRGKIQWQRNFFDHRLRHDESLREKAAYIRANPVRAGLIADNVEWPFAVGLVDVEP